MMDWKDLSGIVGKAAPVLGGLLGGPAGAAVGSLVASALGTKATPDDVSSALLANPEAAARLVELQTNAQVQLQQLTVTAEQNRLQAEAAVYAAEASDRDSARKLAAAQPTDWVRPAITATLLLGAIVIVVFVFTGMADGLLRDATASLTIGTIIGYWFNELKQTLAFWFGMTRDASAQNQAITRFAVDPDTSVTSVVPPTSSENRP